MFIPFHYATVPRWDREELNLPRAGQPGHHADAPLSYLLPPLPFHHSPSPLKILVPGGARVRPAIELIKCSGAIYWSIKLNSANYTHGYEALHAALLSPARGEDTPHASYLYTRVGLPRDKGMK